MWCCWISPDHNRGLLRKRDLELLRRTGFPNKEGCLLASFTKENQLNPRRLGSKVRSFPAGPHSDNVTN